MSGSYGRCQVVTVVSGSYGKCQVVTVGVNVFNLRAEQNGKP